MRAIVIFAALIVVVTARPNPDCGGDAGCGGSVSGNSAHEQSSSSSNTVYESTVTSGGNSAHGAIGLERIGGTQHSAGLTVGSGQYSSGSSISSGQNSAGFSRGSGAGSSGASLGVTNVVVSSQPAVGISGVQGGGEQVSSQRTTYSSGGFSGGQQSGGSINVGQLGSSNVRQSSSAQYSAGSGSIGGGGQSFSSQQYSSLSGGQSIAEEQDLTPIITKQFYVYAAPEEEDVNQAPRYVPIGRPQKNYNIIFIKTPQYGLNSQVIPVVQPNEEKTIVYVLSKKPSFNQDIQLPPVPITEPAKPDVFFIKYKNDKEAIEAQQKIQGAYQTGNLDNSAENVINTVGNSVTGIFNGIPESLGAAEIGAVGGSVGSNYQSYQSSSGQSAGAGYSQSTQGNYNSGGQSSNSQYSGAQSVGGGSNIGLSAAYNQQSQGGGQFSAGGGVSSGSAGASGASYQASYSQDPQVSYNTQEYTVGGGASGASGAGFNQHSQSSSFGPVTEYTINAGASNDQPVKVDIIVQTEGNTHGAGSSASGGCDTC